ncbi:hypothetical protein AYI68_g7739 [Smittium mucronatum]|uniref:Uncharacterized protein n=1 Tax=Smittium mucronatum TaxID=133383 RepID=A0A1R0GMX5_9FUNG|nr:hypothetical protein AYI68_g7739 [Smittium mucronatum]
MRIQRIMLSCMLVVNTITGFLSSPNLQKPVYLIHAYKERMSYINAYIRDIRKPLVDDISSNMSDLGFIKTARN